MKIKDILAGDGIKFSYEVFPPKKGMPFEPILSAIDRLSLGRPDFMSVTYGAGGGTGDNTVRIAAHVQNDLHVTSLAHLTCVSASRAQVRRTIGEMREAGIENILALRGDIPEGSDYPAGADYRYASDLVAEIKAAGDFCVGAACYPEGHVECAHKADDIANLKIKVDSGVDFLTTQMFFDNNVLYNFLYRIRERGITVPVIPGIMPITNANQIANVTKLSGTYVPTRFKNIVDRFGHDPRAMKQAGIAYATEQIIDLIANGIHAIHLYTMNKPDVAEKIRENLSDIIGQPAEG